MPGPPPPLRDDWLSLEQLGRMTRTFDQISREDGRDWPGRGCGTNTATEASYNRGPGQAGEVGEAA